MSRETIRDDIDNSYNSNKTIYCHKASKLNIKTKMFDSEARVLIGWLSQNIRQPANQNTCLKVNHFCFMSRLPAFLTASIYIN